MNFMTGNYVISSWWRKIVSANLIFETFLPKKTISFGFGKYFTYLESPSNWTYLPNWILEHLPFFRHISLSSPWFDFGTRLRPDLRPTGIFEIEDSGQNSDQNQSYVHININSWSKIQWSYEYEQTVQWTMATFEVKCPIIDPLGISTRYHHLNTSKEVFPFIENSTVLMTQFKMTNLVKESGFDRIASLNNPNLREFIGLPPIYRTNRN